MSPYHVPRFSKNGVGDIDSSTRFCLCCLLVTLYFDMFCYRKNDLDDDKQLELSRRSWHDTRPVNYVGLRTCI